MLSHGHVVYLIIYLIKTGIRSSFFACMNESWQRETTPADVNPKLDLLLKIMG